MIKKHTELVKGDIIRCEYGDFDNWVTVVVDSIEQQEHGWCKVTAHYFSGYPVVMYGRSDSSVEFIGKDKNNG